jgi:CheY-like chemotaxis protein
MDESTLRRVFEPFFTTKPPGQGTGLGLAVVHGVMDSHEGAVMVASWPEEGTTFTLYFPENAGKVAPAAIEGPPPRGHGERILVIDDEEVLAVLMQHALGELGYEAVFTTEPEAGLGMVLADPMRFALVLTDQTMPGMTGLVLAGRLRDIRADLPVIMMTGYTAPLLHDRVEAAGVREILLKPVTIRVLGIAVQAALAHAPRGERGTGPFF